jgi:hypothetical protein
LGRGLLFAEFGSVHPDGIEGLTDPRLAGILSEKFSGRMLFEK